MDFKWSAEDLDLQKTVIKMARTLSPGMVERDSEGEFNRKGWKACAELGLMGISVPEEYGGLGASAMTLAGLLEALGYGSTDNGLSFSIGAHLLAVTMPVVEAGTDEQKQRYLPGLASGELIGANAMSEPSAGSDAFALRTRAERQGDTYVLNGMKTFTTNGPIANVYLVFANVSESLAKTGVTAFLVDRDTSGLTVGAPLKKMGMRTSPTSDVYFDNCRIPESARLGPEGGGAMMFTGAMVWERAFILAPSVGAMHRLVDKTVAFARERKQYGKSIGQFQMVASRIVDMKMRYENARNMLYRTAWTKDLGKRCFLEAAMCKLQLSEHWLETAQDALHVHGGTGYMEEYELAREVRDATGSKLYSGTSEIQRNIVAGMLGL